MNIQEKLDFFRQLIQCNHNLSLRSYDPAFILAHSDIMHEAALADDTALILLSLEEPIRKHVENKIHEPLFIDDHLSLIWIVAFGVIAFIPVSINRTMEPIVYAILAGLGYLVRRYLKKKYNFRSVMF